jgi:23S rRNA pseudouridine2457 synthase
MHYYFIVYKPYLVLSQFTTELEKKTLADYFDVPKDVYPLGRLDYDSEGLLILSNDKSLNYNLLHPRFNHEKEYWVQVDGAITQQAITQIQEGVEIVVNGNTYRTKHCRAFLFEETPKVFERNPPIRFRREIPAPWIKIILTEGKNRQVRKMTAKVGYPALRLIRYRIEQIELGDLKPGGIKSLSKELIYKKLSFE